MNDRLHLDFETQSASNLKLAGAFRYSIHKTTRVTHMGYRFNHEPVQQWLPRSNYNQGATPPIPARVADHVRRGGMVVCHNAGFERRIWNHALVRQVPGLPPMEAAQQNCTMARALIVNYPGDLDGLAEVMGIRGKDKAGHALMLRFARPSRIFLDGTCEFHIPTASEAEQVNRYNLQDVEVESKIDELLPELSPKEREIWVLDQIINDRGIPIDTWEVECARALTSAAKLKANAEIRQLTGGMVQKTTEAAKLLEWLRGRGIEATSAGEFELSQLDLSDHPKARAVIDLRTSTAKSSTAKFDKMLGCVCPDGRLRDQYAYAGTATARWAGRIVQVQNLKRTDIKRDGAAFQRIFEAFDAFGLDGEKVYWYVHLVTGEPALDLLARAMRTFIKAPPGKHFIGGDFSNVEGRFNAWISGEAWKVQAFKDYDKRIGPDLYKLAYSRSFGKPVEEISDSDTERQIGKVQELALGYQGGVHAYISMGPTYGVRPGDLMPVVKAATDAKMWQQFTEMYPHARDKCELNLDCWTAIKVLVRSFRLQNPQIAKGWYNLQDAAVKAVDNPGELVNVPEYHNTRYLCFDNMLWCSLPSGRLMAYAQPSVATENNDSLVWSDGHVEDAATYTQDDIKAFIAMGACELIERKPRRQVRYWGKIDGAWRPKRLYGGLQCANIVSASCRDLQADAMLRVEAGGYPVIFHTHDEIVSEVEIGTGTENEFGSLMSEPSPWAPGMPLAVKTWASPRYGK